jgi:hypothetical protein
MSKRDRLLRVVACVSAGICPFIAAQPSAAKGGSPSFHLNSFHIPNPMPANMHPCLHIPQREAYRSKLPPCGFEKRTRRHMEWPRT